MQHPNVHQFFKNILNILSQGISGAFMNTKDRHHIDFISVNVKCPNVYSHSHIPTVVKLGDYDLVFSDFRHVIENLHAWKLFFRRPRSGSRKKVFFRQVNSQLHVGNLKILHRYPHSKLITKKLFYSWRFNGLFKIATAASLPGVFVVASSYLVGGLQLFNPYRIANSISYNCSMLKTYKKYCNFDNLPNHFIVMFKRLSTCDRCMIHKM